MGKTESIFKKIDSLITKGMTPVIQGKNNYNNPTDQSEGQAAHRANVCGGCEEFSEEPVDFLRIKDERIPNLSDKMCGECGCALPYLLRQNLKICSKW